MSIEIGATTMDKSACVIEVSPYVDQYDGSTVEVRCTTHGVLAEEPTFTVDEINILGESHARPSR